MPGARTLLTGPYGAAVRDRLLGASRGEPPGLWLVPSPLARVQVQTALGRDVRAGRAPLVWCWDDLWRAVGEARDDGPARLSPVGARAALELAVGRAADAGALASTAGMTGWPGFLRRLRNRVGGWRRLELSPDRPPRDDGPTAGDEWAIYGHYRAVLRELDAEDAEGFASWASTVLAQSPPPPLRKPGVVTVLDLEDESPAVRRALGYFEAKARAVRLGLAYDGEPALADAFSAVAPLRARLIGRGYGEESHGFDLWRKPCLRDAERELFRDDAHTRPPIADASGLTIVGAPQGEGVALVVAREVRRLLAGEGVAPEDVLVLVRTWDEDAEVLLETLRSWGLPVSTAGRPRDLASEPAVSALRTAMRLPVDGCEAASVVRLLRHGRFQPDWDQARQPEMLARAAAAVRDSGVFRGQDAIRRALDDAIVAEREDGDRRSRSADARRVVDRLIAEVGAIDQPGLWPDHTARVRRLAARLGIGGEGDDALERLWNALDDHAAVLEGAARGAIARPGPFADYLGAVERLVEDYREPETSLSPGTVTLSTVDQAAGARAGHVILANLAEGTFPTREAVESAGDSGESTAVSPAFSREMARFLRVLGSADREVFLAYPTRDEKGQEVLPAGFLDDLLRRLAPNLAAYHKKFERFDPALIDHEDLAVAPADARVRAVALACNRNEHGMLAALATDPRHRRALDGTAAALKLTWQRTQHREFTPFDGLFDDPAAALALAARFGPESTFSPSQLESYLFCPFQFFLKYVLKLKAVDDRDDLDEDFIGRGNTIHKVLEDYETRRRDEGGDRLALADMVIRTELRVELTVGSESDRGLNRIERRRVEQTFRRYLDQAADYESKPKEPPGRPAHLEVSFGGESEHPSLLIGEGPAAVRLQGKIDRVDQVDGPEGKAFRVIDYKTGSCPSSRDVTGLLMVQLPLYALAVERLGLAGADATLLDVGYWGLKEKGYKKIRLDDWDEARARLEARVLDAVRLLRAGVFAVDPKKETCTETCDYAVVCRIGQIRGVGKAGGGAAP